MKRRKILYFACILILLVVNALYVNYEFLITLIILLCIPIVTWLMYFLVLIGLKVTLYIEHFIIHKNDKIKLIIQIFTACPVPISRGRLEVYIEYFQAKDAQIMELPIGLNLNSATEATYIIEPEHLGILDIKLKRFCWTDYTGIFATSRRLVGLKRLIIFPDLIPIDLDTLQKYDEDKEEDQSNLNYFSGYSDDVIGVKNYEQGDALSRIHWKLSVKAEGLQVKEYAKNSYKNHAVLINLSLLDTVNFRADLDLLYQAAYSYGYELLQMCKSAEFVIWNSQWSGMEEIEFSNEQSLEDAIIRLMSVPCAKNAWSSLQEDIHRNDIDFMKSTVLLTAEQIKCRDFQVIQVQTLRQQQ